MKIKAWFSQRRHRQRASGRLSGVDRGEEEENEDNKSESTGSCLEIDDESSMASGGTNSEVAASLSSTTVSSSARSIEVSTRRSRTTSTSTNSETATNRAVFSVHVDQELEKYLRKTINRGGTIDVKEKKAIAAKLGLKPNDIDRWLQIKRTK